MRLGIALCLIALVCAAPAGAAFTPATAPFPDIRGFAVSGDRWFAINGDDLSMGLSADSGQTVPYPVVAAPVGAIPNNGVSVSPAGEFWVPMGTASGPRLYKIANGQSTLTAFPTALETSANADTFSPPAWDSQGRMWL